MAGNFIKSFLSSVFLFFYDIICSLTTRGRITLNGVLAAAITLKGIQSLPISTLYRSCRFFDIVFDSRNIFVNIQSDLVNEELRLEAIPSIGWQREKKHSGALLKFASHVEHELPFPRWMTFFCRRWICWQCVPLFDVDMACLFYQYAGVVSSITTVCTQVRYNRS